MTCIALEMQILSPMCLFLGFDQETNCYEHVLLAARYFFFNLCQSTGERWADERREKEVNSTRKRTSGKKAPRMLECRRGTGDKRGRYEQIVKKEDFTAEEEGESKRRQNATAGGGSTHLVGWGAIQEAC